MNRFFSSQSVRHRSRRAPAFTLIELLVVIAIISILAAILIPTVGSVRASAKRAETKVRFSQWATAMEQFKQEYGYYPQIDGGGTANKVNPARFAGALTGIALDGSAATSVDLAGNQKLVAFYSIGESELAENRTKLVDAFGNSDIAVFYDKNGDGRITGADGAVVGVSPDGVNTYQPEDADLALSTTDGVRASVIFYSPGKGGSQSDIIFSWK